jgi:hypothetical protein
MNNTPTSGRPSDRAIAEIVRKKASAPGHGEGSGPGGARWFCCCNFCRTIKEARELDAAHPVADEAVYCYVYEWDDWGGGAHRSLSAGPWNGLKPDRAVSLYTHPLPTIAAQASVSEEAPVEWQTRHKWPETNQWSSWLTHADVVSANRHYLGHSSFGVEVQMRELHAKLVVPKSEEKSTCLHGYPHCGCGETLGEFVGAPERITAQKGGVHHG